MTQTALPSTAAATLGGAGMHTTFTALKSDGLLAAKCHAPAPPADWPVKTTRVGSPLYVTRLLFYCNETCEV